jgi:hypothetical protein
VSQSFRESHYGLVNRGHLRRKHDLNLIPWFDPFDHRKHKIEESFVNLSASRTTVAKLLKKPKKEVVVRCANGFHE